MRKEKLLKLGVFMLFGLAAAAGQAGAEDRGSDPGGRRMERPRGGGGEGFRGEDRAEGGFRGENRGQQGGRSIIKMRTIRLSRPERLEQGRIVNDNRRIAVPRRFGNGAEIREQELRVPPSRHSEIVGDLGIRRSIDRARVDERVRNRFYWHDSGGRRFAHFRDDHDIDWFGFYFGPTFYWTRYYGNRWWWYDPGYARWVFWWDGYWWWQGPGGLAYVYMDNNYYPYEEGSVTVQKAAPVSPAEAAPVPGTGKQWTSPDLRRMVEVTGTQDAAFLYDRTGPSPVFISYLGREVSNVRFSGGAAGQPLQILLDFKDGTFALFDEYGKSMQPQATGPAPDLPASPPLLAPGATGAYTPF